jgi:hypothetical protein
MAAAMWHYGEPFYVSLFELVDGKPTRWLGWLGKAGVEENYAELVLGPQNEVPPAEAAQVQWVYDAQVGNATNPASYAAALATRPRYLSSEGRILDGTGGDGFYPYWRSANIGDKGYPLTVRPTEHKAMFTLSRVSDPAGSAINTYDWRLGYYKSGD